MLLKDACVYKGSKKSGEKIHEKGRGALISFERKSKTFGGKSMSIQIDIPASGSNASGQFGSVVIIELDKNDLLSMLNEIVSFLGDEIKQKFKFK